MGIISENWLKEHGYDIENYNIITYSDGTRLTICLNCQNVISENDIEVDNHGNEICPHCHSSTCLNDCWNDNIIHAISFLKYHLVKQQL